MRPAHAAWYTHLEPSLGSDHESAAPTPTYGATHPAAYTDAPLILLDLENLQVRRKPAHLAAFVNAITHHLTSPTPTSNQPAAKAPTSSDTTRSCQLIAAVRATNHTWAQPLCDHLGATLILTDNTPSAADHALITAATTARTQHPHITIVVASTDHASRAAAPHIVAVPARQEPYLANRLRDTCQHVLCINTHSSAPTKDTPPAHVTCLAGGTHPTTKPASTTSTTIDEATTRAALARLVPLAEHAAHTAKAALTAHINPDTPAAHITVTQHRAEKAARKAADAWAHHLTSTRA